MKLLRDLDEIESRYDVAIAGAGPAGLAAAADASRLGLNVLLLDENATAGGQIYRSLQTTPLRDRRVLGADYWRGESVLEEFSRSQAKYAPQATVWSVRGASGDGACELGISMRGHARLIEAGQIILATGALERPFPISGWTLPGVLSAGGAQTALKNAGLVPDGRVVVAGCGPLLLLLVAQLCRAGARIAALIDTKAQGSWTRALPWLPDFLRSQYAAKGAQLLYSAMRGTRVITGVVHLHAEGGSKLESVVIRRRNGTQEQLAADTLLLHQGVVPNTNLSAAAGCRHQWNDEQLAFVPQLDEWLASSVEGIAIAGDGAGIAGAQSAQSTGRLAALGAVLRLGGRSLSECEQLAAPVRAQLLRAGRGRRFLDLLYRPDKAFRVPVDEATIVCRCEEVTAGQVRAAVALGCGGPNQLKTFLRCGMGPCQGRMCGLTVTEMIADCRGVRPDEVGYYRLRPPVKPITVAELAALPSTAEALRAVER